MWHMESPSLVWNSGSMDTQTALWMRVALVNNYRNKLIKWQPGQILRNTTKTFEDMKGFPRIVGAINGTHIPIKVPIENQNDYINRKFSILFSFKTKSVDFN